MHFAPISYYKQNRYTIWYLCVGIIAGPILAHYSGWIAWVLSSSFGLGPSEVPAMAAIALIFAVIVWPVFLIKWILQGIGIVLMVLLTTLGSFALSLK